MEEKKPKSSPNPFGRVQSHGTHLAAPFIKSPPPPPQNPIRSTEFFLNEGTLREPG